MIPAPRPHIPPPPRALVVNAAGAANIPGAYPQPPSGPWPPPGYPQYPPPPPRRNTRLVGMLAAGAVLIAAVATGAVVLAERGGDPPAPAASASGSTTASSTTGPPATSTTPTTTTPAAPSGPPVAASALPGLLLGTDELANLAGAAVLVVTQSAQVLSDDSPVVDAKDCVGAWVPAQRAVYGDSGWSAAQQQLLRSAGDGPPSHTVTQMVV